MHVYTHTSKFSVQAEELRKAIVGAIEEKLGIKTRDTSRDQLRAAAEAIKYEDWAIDFDLVSVHCHQNQKVINNFNWIVIITNTSNHDIMIY